MTGFTFRVWTWNHTKGRGGIGLDHVVGVHGGIDLELLHMRLGHPGSYGSTVFGSLAKAGALKRGNLLQAENACLSYGIVPLEGRCVLSHTPNPNSFYQ